MFILTQDSKAVINGEYVREFFIEQDVVKDEVRLMASADEDILLGTYPKLDHATTALKFIGACMVDEDAQGKITAVPSQEDMALKDELLGGSKPSAAALGKLMEKLAGGALTPPHDFDLSATLDSLFNL